MADCADAVDASTATAAATTSHLQTTLFITSPSPQLVRVRDDVRCIDLHIGVHVCRPAVVEIEIQRDGRVDHLTQAKRVRVRHQVIRIALDEDSMRAGGGLNPSMARRVVSLERSVVQPASWPAGDRRGVYLP